MKILAATGPLPRPGWRALLLDGALAVMVGFACYQAATDDAGRGPRRIFPRVPLDPPIRPNASIAPDAPIPPYASIAPHAPILRDPPILPEFPSPEQPGAALGALLLVFVMCAPLVLRRRYPLAVLWATMAAESLALIMHGVRQPNLYPCVVIVCLIAVYSAAAHSPFRAPALATVPAAALLVTVLRDLMLITVPGEYLPFVLLAPLVAAAGGHHVWTRRVGEDRQRLAAEVVARERALRDAVDGERSRIARELHDVVTHHVSVMVIQAGAARAVLTGAPDQAREALLAVESTGRSALTELRHVMGLLSAPAADVPEEPQPGIEGLPALVARMRDAGVAVELTTRGERRPVADGIGLAAYRVVQEALTNMVRHAPGATATVVVDYTPETLTVTVGNTAPVLPAVPRQSGGSGLIGLRERLAVYGGTLRAEPRLGGGFTVEASIPMEGV